MNWRPLFAHAYTHTVLRHIQHNVHALPADAPVSSIVLRFVERRFNWKQEQEADDLAFLIHARAGWDPGAVCAMLQESKCAAAASGARLSRSWSICRGVAGVERPPIAERGGSLSTVSRQQASRGGKSPQPAERLLRALRQLFYGGRPASAERGAEDFGDADFQRNPQYVEKGHASDDRSDKPFRRYFPPAPQIPRPLR